MKDYSGAHIEVKVVEDFKFFNYLSNFNMQRCMQPRNSGTPILFLGDDVAVQRDLTGLWKIDMDGSYAWRREKSTEEYHYWQNMNENRKLWKLGTLPPGLITFYSTTKVLDRSWHVLDPRFNPIINVDDINNVVVVHFNGNMKPWLDNAIIWLLWSKYVDKENEHVQACNFNFGDG
ncbi:hypothetical protein KY289_036434 [Solanum tuberosum]|nr:hypothetical protein KY289_036434 [Solanum tuberosum]